ncbi:acetylglutamate kinase [Collinsella ihumii]|uniref:Acetylglutamate kinase n=1 Tax=Collinsella ihumii TaxID=1720204 RepID=A0AAW7K2S8_9ACTN|nr:acetylglutamate kinase [Collinsella ihumii]MCF6412402.1 acetylglutamate kinase [Collinsella tanakaei]MDN0069896.1 acetylglutamate kinase [Collinsella ihumii]
MKYARDSRSASRSDEETAQLLFEALPWIKNLTGKTVVIKYGGAAMVDSELRADVMSDIVLLKIIGMKPVIVHGGGKDINEALSHYDIPVEFKHGQRVTDDATMEIVREVLGGKVNQELVAAINVHGNLAVGVSGADAGTIVARELDPELGRVGKIVRVNADYLESIMDNEYIPVVATVAQGEDGGFFNINADVAAGHIAAAVHAHKVIFLTDVDGLYEDFSDKDSLISNLTLEETEQMLARGEVDKGMIPKLESCIHALKAGVFRSHIINGTTPHSLLLELLTDAGVGTVIHSTHTAYEQDTHPHPHPLTQFAARLSENI